MYGIVTNALQWYFIQWAGSPEDPTIEVSGPHQCEFDSEELEQAKQIVKYIVSILQHQVRGLKNEEVRHQIKKRRQKFFRKINFSISKSRIAHLQILYVML